jgi:hypothetical protein
MIEDASYKTYHNCNIPAIAPALNRYDEFWAEWRQLEKTAPYCATLYTEYAFRNQQEGSVGELVQRLRMILK